MADQDGERPKISLAKKRLDPPGVSLEKPRGTPAAPVAASMPSPPQADQVQASASEPAVVAEAPTALSPASDRRESGERNVLILLGAAVVAVVLVASVAVVALVAMNSKSSTQQVGTAPAAATATTAASAPSLTPSASPTTSIAPHDPLDVGMPLANVGCDGKYLLILDSTDLKSEYLPKLTAAHAAVSGAKYLRTDGSCSGFNRTGGHGGVIYAAYLGPFPTVEDACSARSDTGLPLAYVKLLSSSAKSRSLCACTTGVSQLPVLDTDTDYDPTPARGQAVADLQALLYRAGVNKQMVIGGHFRESTHDWVVAYQQREGLDVNGTADAQTWESLKDNYC